MRFSITSCLLLCSLTSLVLLSCGEKGWKEPFPNRNTIGIRDSIGAEFGDSTIVFGSISDAVYSPAGEIYILDQTACCIRKYSPEGVLLKSFSRRGNGPGELRFPTDIAVMDNGYIIVRDVSKYALVILDDNGESVSEFLDWSLIFPPDAIALAGSGHIAGYEANMVADGADYLVVLKPALYSVDDGARQIELLQDSMLVTLEGMASSLNGLQDISTMATDDNGRIFYTRSSTDEYKINCWDATGQALFTFQLNFPSVEKTAQEIQEETEYARIRLAALGGALPEGFAPDPMHNLVKDIGVDNKGNLWVQRGTESNPVFDVVDSSGRHIASVDFPRNGRYWRFSITPYGSLAWDMDPESGVQRVYILDLPEVNQNNIQ